MNRRVKHVQTHQVIFVGQGLGQLKATLSTEGNPGLEMSYTTDGIACEWKGVSFMIPLANVVVAVFCEAARQTTPLKDAKAA